MNTHTPARFRLIGLFLILALVAAACGGDGEDAATEAPAADEPTEAAVATPTPIPTPTPTPTAEAPEPEPTDETKPEETLEPAPVATTEAPTAEPTAEVPDDAGTTDGGLASAGDSMGVGGEATYDSYTLITDDAGTIEVEVPTEWDKIDGRPFADAEGNQLFDVRTAPDLDGFNDTWDVPGIIITASSDVAQSANEITLLDQLVEPLSQQCTYLGRDAYDDGLYTGQVDIFDACGGTETGYVVIGAVPTDRAFVIRVQVQVTEDRDLEALARAIETFRVIGDV